MLFYRVLLFSYLINSLITLVPKLILAIAYLFFSSVILISLLTMNIASSKYALLNPSESLYYLLSYTKWIWINKKHISLQYFFYTLVSFITPYIAWGYIKNGLKTGVKELKTSSKKYITSLMRRLAQRLTANKYKATVQESTVKRAKTGKKVPTDKPPKARTSTQQENYENRLREIASKTDLREHGEN